MAGTINSLGLGSGVLTSDLIDKLKKNDAASIIAPIDRKITLQKQKDSAMSLLNSLLSAFKSSTSALNDDALYQKRTVSGSTDAIKVTAASGVATQSFAISDTQMALQNIKQSGAFGTTADLVSAGAGTAKLTVGSVSYKIDYTSTTSLEQLKESINSAAGASAKASILQVGDKDFRLILTSTATGVTQAVTLENSAGTSLDAKLLPYDAITNPPGVQDVQKARDSSFKYNGIPLTRSTNEISDLIVGVTIGLNQNGSNTNIVIARDTKAISDEMSIFTSSYNTLTSQLKDMTTADPTTGAVGIFNGDSSINAITSEINNIITSTNSSGMSLINFGLDLNEGGVMKFNSNTFTAKFNANPAAAETLLSGSTTVVGGNTVTTDGTFTALQNLLDDYKKSNGKITTLTTESIDESKRLETNKLKSQALLDARYNTMSARFAQYDSLISKFNTQFSSLRQQINAQGSSS